ncbi:hypothetical protein L914_13465 [Phytophthora nicotianae]|uniref:Uncharacterized protein n=1 Tax=Phytophthora nicotianae TaxID=4792 RepID=W2MWH0_PHYNI|nr:hypothetical protein L914_13465 [Phytophthora nicotianae]
MLPLGPFPRSRERERRLPPDGTPMSLRVIGPRFGSGASSNWPLRGGGPSAGGGGRDSGKGPAGGSLRPCLVIHAGSVLARPRPRPAIVDSEVLTVLCTSHSFVHLATDRLVHSFFYSPTQL